MRDDQPIATLAPSAFRRGTALICMFGLGLVLMYLSLTVGRFGVWTFLVLVLGIGVLVAAELMRRGTRDEIHLTDAGLITQSGVVLAPSDKIVKVERALFAIKPTNGFLVHLDGPMSRLWVPGLYWRVGRFVGIGGVTAAGQGRFMAEAMQAKLHAADTDQ